MVLSTNILEEATEFSDGQCSTIGAKTFQPQFDGSVSVNVLSESGIPQDGGVYFYHDLRGVLYIGRTGNFRRRFRKHYYDSHNPDLTMVISNQIGDQNFSWILAPDIREMKSLEKQMIRVFNPHCNKSS